MDAKNCTSLEEIRYHIDLIDEQIVSLLAKRGGYVNQAAKFKTNIGNVEDRNRIQEIISKVTKYANELDFDQSVVTQIYEYLIQVYIQYERKTFEKNQSP